MLMSAITVLVVDDHEVVRRGLHAFLDLHTDLQVVGEAADGEQAVAFVVERVPDVVVMDIVMANEDGVEATRRIRKLSPRTQVVVLTSYHEDAHIFPALQAGAISYILKDVEMEELAEVIRRAARGEATLHPQVALRMINEVQDGQAAGQGRIGKLTMREREVLMLVATGLSNAEIAQRLVIGGSTVKGHVSSILSKLHLADRTQAAVYAWREGLVGEM
jgi:NarL family two-component system response regulator LiaR